MAKFITKKTCVYNEKDQRTTMEAGKEIDLDPKSKVTEKLLSRGAIELVAKPEK
ncbi:MAG: hypothetical protein K6L81_01935 [Agarilytica sp.]